MMRNCCSQVTQNLNLCNLGFTLFLQKYRSNSTKGPVRIIECGISIWEKRACTLTEAVGIEVNVYLANRAVSGRLFMSLHGGDRKKELIKFDRESDIGSGRLSRRVSVRMARDQNWKALIAEVSPCKNENAGEVLRR
jgi:hypothetical protein